MTENKQIALYVQRTSKDERQKRYRVMGLIMFCIAAGLLLVRLLVYYIPVGETAADVIFTLLVQVGFLVLLPLLIYLFVLKMNFKQVLEFSNIRRTKWYNLLLAVPIALCFYALTLAISTIWQGFISIIGYTHTSSDTLPETFNAGILILNIVLTGVLPGICEEFACRGGFLTTIRSSFPFVITLLIMGVQFGLFHQHITQMFYTAVFGAFMAFLTLKLKSILPAMIIHFTNNTFSVFNDFCYKYGWLNGGVSKAIEDGIAYRPLLVVATYLIVVSCGIGLVILLLHLNSARRLSKKKDVIASSGFDHTNNRVVLVGAEDTEKVRELGLDKEVYGAPLKEQLYKPTLADNAFLIGAAVIATLYTLFSFIFGAMI